MKFILCQGLGDAVWGLHKIQSVNLTLSEGDASPIEVYLSGSGHHLESRALDFVRRFSFVKSVEMRPFDIHTRPQVSPEGYYNYIEDGWHEFARGDGIERVCALMPNGPLERGVRLEDWLPHYKIRWNIFDDFRISLAERDLAMAVKTQYGPYAVFYLGPLAGNTTSGHNRGPLWTPNKWVYLAKRIHEEFGLSIVVVGASYDAPYFDQFIGPVLDGDKPWWVNLIGKTNIGQLFAVTGGAKFVVSYQAGVGIVSAYRDTPTAIWWRPRGDSISNQCYLSFEESMAAGWASPQMLQSGRYFPMVYNKHDIADIMDWAKSFV